MAARKAIDPKRSPKQIFNMGNAGAKMIDLRRAGVIERDGPPPSEGKPARYFIEVGGIRHVVESELTLEQLAGFEPIAAADEQD